jgi:MFS family permease
VVERAQSLVRRAAPSDIEPKTLRVLHAVALALLFEEYDIAILTSALSRIAADLGMAESDFGMYLGVIRLGAVPAFVFVPLADRFGRRPIFIGSTVLLGVLTFATAFVSTPLQFVALQALTRTFFMTGSAVAFVIIAEEFPARRRGWGLGAVAALGSTGHGLGAFMFALIDTLPFGWRSLYAFGIVPVMCLPLFLRSIPETTRFTQLHGEPSARVGVFETLSSSLVPLRMLFETHAARSFALCVSGFLVAAAMLPAFQFSGHYTQAGLGFRPAQYSLMVICAGALGLVGNVVAGRLGDSIGRRRVGVVMLALCPAAVFAFYFGPTWVVVLSWVPLVFCSMGGRVILRALSTELFPTSHRGAAAGAFSVAEALGAVCAMFAIHAYGTADIADLAMIVAAISLLAFGSAACVLLFPETRMRELEEIALH